jgi:hypothetical protein
MVRVMALPPRVDAKQRTLLAIIAADSTFERASAGEREVWSGKCLHCNARLNVAKLEEKRKARWRAPPS